MENKFNKSFFYNEAYLNTQSSENGVLEFEGFEVAYYIQRKGIFSKLSFTSGVISPSGEAIDLSDHARVVSGLIEQAKKLDVDYIAQPMAHVFFDSIPEGAIGVKWSSPVISLCGDSEDILAAMHKKHRNVIRKAEKSNIVVDFDAAIEDVHRMILGTMEKQNRGSVSLSVLKELKDQCKNVLFVTCRVDNALQGVAVIPYDQDKGYYLYGGSCSKTMPGALNYMHYRIMLELKSMKIKSYDMMGYRLAGTEDVKIQGIQRFKVRFGADLEEGYTWKYILKPRNYRLQVCLLKLMGFLRRRPYLGDVIDQGNK